MFIKWVFTHSEHRADGVLAAQDERTSVPEGQSVWEIDHQEGEAHRYIGRDGLLHSHLFGLLQVFMISGVQQTQSNIHLELNLIEVKTSLFTNAFLGFLFNYCLFLVEIVFLLWSTGPYFETTDSLGAQIRAT